MTEQRRRRERLRRWAAASEILVEKPPWLVKNQKVHDLEPSWGEKAGIEFDALDPAGFVSGSRGRVVALCSKYLEPSDATAQLIMSAQELLENIAKYSAGARARFEFELFRELGRPKARMRSENPASGEHLRKACEILDEIIAAQDPQALYDRWIALSGDREGSGLGLIRIRAEAGMDLSYEAEAGQLCIEAIGPVQAKRSS